MLASGSLCGGSCLRALPRWGCRGIDLLGASPAASCVMAFTAAMVAPRFDERNGSATVSFAAPKSASHIAIYFFEGENDIKRMFAPLRGSVDTGVLLPTGEVGRTWPVPQRRTPARFTELTFTVKGLKPDTKYTAAFSAREADELSFGPESLRSLPMTLTLPKAPAKPVVLPAHSDGNAAIVHFAAPFRCNGIEIVFTNEAGLETSTKSNHVAHSRTGHVAVQGLNRKEKYSVVVFSVNGAGRTASPSTSYCPADHVPVCPCAPDVEVLGETSIRISYTVPAMTHSRLGTTKAALLLRAGSMRFYVHPGTLSINLVPSIGQAPNFGPQNQSVTVTALTADTTYAICVRAGNSCGWSRDSPTTTVTTKKGEVEITRVRSADERDAELIKNAVDVDESPAKRAKRVKQQLAELVIARAPRAK